MLAADSSDDTVDLSRLWAGEEMTVEQETTQSAVLREFEETISFKDGRYWIGLPWLRVGQFDSNFSSALYRLPKLIDRLRMDNTYDEYQRELLQLVADGHAERVAINCKEKAFYMPHRGMWRQNALTTKLRVVFDASSHRRDQDPLNARLAKGVDLNSTIVSLMVKFRSGSIASIADLQKAFLQNRINEEDRNYLRFLWIDAEDNLMAYRMTSMPFGATCSPFLLAFYIFPRYKVFLVQKWNAFVNFNKWRVRVF